MEKRNENTMIQKKKNKDSKYIIIYQTIISNCF